jgi:hypothetical protein
VSRRDDVIARLWRARADLGRRIGRRGDAGAALDVIGRADRSRPSQWVRATSAGVDRYRSAFRPAAATAAVICVSQRPWLFADAVANVARQVDLDIEAVFVTNHPGFADIDLDRHLEAVPRVTVIDLPVTVTLGACLNAGLAATGERFVAKFDDDDWYGTHYLADALRAHTYAGAGVVGKHSYYADVGEPPARYLRFPGHEFSYTSTLAGGTLVIDRERVGELAFDDVSIGEDRQFIRSCHRRGVSTFSADRFGFVQRRTGDNTWAVPDAQFLVGCVAVDPADPVHVVDR